MSLLLTVAIAPPALTQEAAPPTAEQPESPQTTQSPTLNPSLVPEVPLVDEIDSFFSGNADIVRGAVNLDGRRLFWIAAQATSDNEPDNQTLSPIEFRVNTIEERLRRIASTPFDPESLDVYWERDDRTNQPVIFASFRIPDDRTEEEGEAELIVEQIMTVTGADAQISATGAASRASELQRIIEAALLDARLERQPAYLRRQIMIAGIIIVGMGLGSLALTMFQKRLKAERQILAAHTQVDPQQVVGNTDDSASHEITTALLQQKIAYRQRHSVNDIERRLLQAAQLGIWGGGIYFILGLFPNSRWWQPVILNAMRIPVILVLVVFATYVAIRASAVSVDRLFWVLQRSSQLAPEASQRLALRFSTFSGVVKSVVAATLIGIGAIAALAVVGLEVGPLLAGAGIIGLGISFASQSLIKDIINGFLILFEDQYGVGDVIIVGDVAGFVENMNLRITQLRNEEGRLITIPNSAISIVQNLSKEWSRVDLKIEIAHNANIDEALQVIKQTAEDMTHELPWKDLILEPPALLGVDNLDHMGSMVRMWIKTQPLKQWDVARECRRRLKIALDDAGIQIGSPQQLLWFGNALDLGHAGNGDRPRPTSPSDAQESEPASQE